MALAAAVAVVTTLSQRGEQDETVATATVDATQRTVLVSVEDSGVVTGASLLGVDSVSASALVVPSGLIVPADDGSDVPLADSAAAGDAAPAAAVSRALDVRVDGGWLLTSTGLAQLVDAVGGVVVDVDAEVRADEVLVVAGPGQRLTGVQAAAYASYLGEGEPVTAKLARFDQVLSAAIAGMPTDPQGVTGVLTGLGASSRSTIAPDDVSVLLADAAEDAAQGRYEAAPLPVVPVPDSDPATYELQVPGWGAVVDEFFAAASL